MQCNQELLAVFCFDLRLSLVELLRTSTTGGGAGGRKEFGVYKERVVSSVT